VAAGGGLLLGAGERRRGVRHTTSQPGEGQGAQVKEMMGREGDQRWGRGRHAGDGHSSLERLRQRERGREWGERESRGEARRRVAAAGGTMAVGGRGRWNGDGGRVSPRFDLTGVKERE
jgi:hypothetical protein